MSLLLSKWMNTEPSVNYRSSHPEVFCKNSVLKNFAKFIGKDLCQRLFFNKVAGLRPATLLKKSLCYRCFSVNFAKFLRTFFLQNSFGGCLWNSGTPTDNSRLIYLRLRVFFFPRQLLPIRVILPNWAELIIIWSL